MDTVNEPIYKPTKFTTCENCARLFMHQGKRLIITKLLLPIFQFYIYEARHRQNLILAILAIEKSIPKSDLKKWIVTENIVSVNL